MAYGIDEIMGNWEIDWIFRVVQMGCVGCVMGYLNISNGIFHGISCGIWYLVCPKMPGLIGHKNIVNPMP